MKTKIAILLLTLTAAPLSWAQSPGNPEDSGLIPTTPTFYVNTNYPSNGSTESEGVAIAANGNVLLGWEDDGAGLADFESAWTLFDGNGNMLTPVTVQTNRSDLDPPNLVFQSITNTWLSYFRADGSPVPAYTAWGPKIKANLFGNGIGMGATAFSLGLEVAELGAINLDAGGGGDFAAVQMLNNDGSPGTILTGGTDANYEPAGDVRIGDFDFLSNGNIVIVGESRQADDRALTGQLSGNVPVYRIVTPAGVEVKGWTAVSATADSAEIWHGVGVTANGFAVRFAAAGVSTVRMFDNAGNPTTTNINLAELTGNPDTGSGGRGDSVGFHGNGVDAYVQVTRGAGNDPNITVLNANGTLRWSRRVADEGADPINATRVDGTIAADGRVIAVWASPLLNPTIGLTKNYVQGRLFSADGSPLGGPFLVSEWERPENPLAVNNSVIPRVAWRGNTLAITWQSENAPTVLADPFGPYPVLAARFFTVGFVPVTPTFYVNTNYFNNGSTESEGVAIAANGNVLLGWEDDGAGLADFESAWTLFDWGGNRLTPETIQTNRSDLDPPNLVFQSVTNTFLSFFRADGSPTPAHTAWGPKIKANMFGNGIGHGATAFSLGLEVAELGAINLDAGGGGDFAAVQLLNNDGAPISILTGGTDANYEPAGDVRIADFDYLANGNIVIAGESRQVADRPPEQTGGEVPVYRVVTPAGVEVKAYSLISSVPATNNSAMWHGAGVTANGFALRFRWQGLATVRLFDNAGNPTSTNIDLAALTGIPAAGGGSRGDDTGFHGNGNDAYVHICGGTGGPWLTVLNANGTLRYVRSVADAGDDIVTTRVDAAIVPDGRVLAVWESPLLNADGISNNRLIQGRFFMPDGTPFGGKFVVSEWEHPSNTNLLYNSYIPRVAWRGEKVAITWQSENAPTVLADPFGPYPVLAARFFTVPGTAAPSQPTLTISRSGGNIIITWEGSGTLQSADSVTGTWNDLTGVNSGDPIPAAGNSKYFRLRVQ